MPKETAVRIRREEKHSSKSSAKEKQSKLKPKLTDGIRRKKRNRQERVLAGAAGAALLTSLIVVLFQSYHGIQQNHNDHRLNLQLAKESNSFLPPVITQTQTEPVIPEGPLERSNTIKEEATLEVVKDTENATATVQESRQSSSQTIATASTLEVGKDTTTATTTVQEPHQPSSQSSASSGRFPLYGNAEFAHQCPYVVAAQPTLAQTNCTVLVRAQPNSNEGIASWASSVTTAYFMSLEKHCTLYVDYLPGVDLSQILTASTGASWHVPPKDFHCVESKNCYDAVRKYSNMTPLLKYRFLYRGKDGWIQPAMQRLFSGFQVKTGMACAWAQFQLAPSASKYVPHLFTQLLPALRDPTSLVLTLYIRTGRTDALAKKEDNHKSAKIERLLKQDHATSLDGPPVKITACALQLEQEFLGKNPQKQRVVWMIVTDSPNVGRLVMEKYSAESVGVTNRTGNIPRVVLTTQSRGIQTKPSRNPTTADVAEGMIDWFLIGESDLVVQGRGISFGSTGALRTARTLYSSSSCEALGPGSSALPPSTDGTKQMKKVMSEGSSLENSTASVSESLSEITMVDKRMAVATVLPSISTGRFPLYGTPQFRRFCPYAANIPLTNRSNCTVLVRPLANSNEGVAAWTAAVTTAYFLSLKKHCTFYVDYLPKVNITQILKAPSGATWQVPPKDFECRMSDNCYTVESQRTVYMRSFPLYRFLSSAKLHQINMTQWKATQREFPGFQVSIGMACAWAQFHLTPSASQFVPHLFTQLLPALRDPNTLVLTLYIRTGRTDAWRKHKHNRMEPEDTTSLEGTPEEIVDCALQLEQEYLGMDLQKQRVVWMIVSDSPNVGRLIMEKYSDRSVENTNRTGNIPRTVLTTQSRGIQTKPNRNPTTADVAEGMIDWFLIGESDLVVQGAGKSFGSTGALRTARTLYNSANCGEKNPDSSFFPPSTDGTKQMRKVMSSIEISTVSESLPDITLKEKDMAVATVLASATSPGRFPLYGTPEFAQVCPYAVNIPFTTPTKCTILVQPPPNSNEGIAAWTSAVTAGYFMSLEKHCALYVDYLPGVDLSQILAAPSGATWQVRPKNFECLKSKNCYAVLSSVNNKSPLPDYRFLYNPSVQHVKKTKVTAAQRVLQRIFPGFQVKTGMACAWAHFQLAPSASQYVPHLFTQLLPALRDPTSLVLTLYIRTGRTDALEKQERKFTNTTAKRLLLEEAAAAVTGTLARIPQCALQLEKEHLNSDPRKQRVVWMIVTDSPHMGKLIVNQYDNQSETTVHKTSVSRTVLLTHSRGIHTKPRRHPNTADIAEGIIDWFLIGESDLVIQGGGISFGATGALRTARSLYNSANCGEKIPDSSFLPPSTDGTKQMKKMISEGPSMKNSTSSVLVSPSENIMADKRMAVATVLPSATSRGRFPLYGTPEFAQACPYTVNIPSTTPTNCTILVRPSPNSNEGVAAWTASITTGYFMSLEKHCALYVDYLPGVDLSQILTAPSGATWQVPPKDFECLESKHCYTVLNSHSGNNMSPLLNYRFLYSPSTECVKATQVTAAQRIFPGFQVNTGMACAWAQFQLAPSASQYVPNLFTQLLPALRDPTSLVLTLYIRTGRTDALVRQERNLTSAKIERLLKQDNATSLDGPPVEITACALQLEQEFLDRNPHKQRVVWMVVTDSPNVGRLIMEKYGDKSVGFTKRTGTFPRTVLTTQSRGIQTRPSRHPTTADVAEGMIDWFLIGESDLVIQGGGFSFGMTGALRRALPLYNSATCREAFGAESFFLPPHNLRCRWNKNISIV